MGGAAVPLSTKLGAPSLYATLASWGLHRMGPGKATLVDLPVMVQAFRRQYDRLQILEKMTIDCLADEALASDLIWQTLRDLEVGIGNTKIVSGSKALHHLLPNLVPPFDRQYTVKFFLNLPNAIQGDEIRQ